MSTLNILYGLEDDEETGLTEQLKSEVDETGKPIVGARYAVITAGATVKLKKARGSRSALKHRPVVCGEGETDADGRFHIDGIIPGHKSELAVSKPDVRLPDPVMPLSLRSDETRDLGDVVVK